MLGFGEYSGCMFMINDLFDSVPKSIINNPNAYPALPGTGNNGFKCKNCKHIARVGHDSGISHLKCGVIKHRWTSSHATDIQAKSPACTFFENKNRG